MPLVPDAEQERSADGGQHDGLSFIRPGREQEQTAGEHRERGKDRDAVDDVPEVQPTDFFTSSTICASTLGVSFVNA